MAVWLARFKLDCRNCSEEEQVLNGCVTDSPYQDAWCIEHRGLSFNRCPLKIVTRQSMLYIDAYHHLKLGHGFPGPGTWREQSAKFMAAINIIEQEVLVLRRESKKGE